MSDYVLTPRERESAEAREGLWSALGRRPDELYKIASALTAAEERGRLAAAVVCKCGDELQPDDGAICGACLQPEIAEAEERGRRRGVEELTDAKALLTEIRHELLRMDGGHGSIAELPASLRRASTVARLSNAIRALDAALAPRDSGKEEQ